MRLLIYGIGNPGRQDDGLGIFFTEKIEEWAKEKNLTNVKVDSNYQLSAEDSLEISEYDIVIFADASKEEIQDIYFREIKGDRNETFTTHSMRPETIVALAKELYNRQPESYIMSIKGYEWEVNEKMTGKAAQNLDKALEEVKKFISEKL